MRIVKRIMVMGFAMLLFVQQAVVSFAAMDEEDDRDVEVTATVEAAEPEYYVTFPSTISLGEITEDKDISVSYDVVITMKNTQGGTLRVSTAATGYFYLDGDTSSDALKYTNTFKTRDFTESTNITATISVSKEDVAKVTKGNYWGSLTITSTFYPAGSDIPAIEEDEEVTYEEDLTGVEKTVHIMKSTDIGTASMSDPLIYDKAYLTNNNDGTTTVSLYAIDPVPGFSTLGKPVETFIACGSDEDVNVTGTTQTDYEIVANSDSFASVATIEEKVSSLYYDASGVFIPEAGYYDSDRITFTVSNSAIRNSKTGALFAEVFVGTAMQSWQKLYIVIDDVDDWSTGGSEFVAEALPGSNVNGLSDFANDNPDYGDVSMTMTTPTSSTETVEAKSAIEDLLTAKDYGRDTTYYSIDITDENGNAITSTGSDHVLEIVIPWTYDSTKTVSIFRAHGDENDITQFASISKRTTSGAIDGTFYFDKDANKIYLYSNKFSLYAIHQEDKSSSSVDDDDATTTSTTSSTTSSEDEEEDEDGTYKIPVTMKKYSDFSSNSMCDTLFYDYATVVISGSTAKVTVYVIDPIPNYQSYGTPISNVKVKYGSKTVSATLNSSNAVGLYFAADSSFIPTSGYYMADPVTFSIPYAYLEGSSNKTVLMQAYVNAVMASTESFYMVFDTANRVKDGSLNTSSDLVDLDEIEELDADEETEDEELTDKLEDGTYTVKMGAKKSNSDEDSMMATYMYPTGQLVVSGDDAALTFYVQHTVAGKENGGPEYIKYKDEEATKVSKAETFDGVVYDSFTISNTTNPIPSILPITMYVNAMGMEVGCRLTVDTDLSSTSTTTKSSSSKSSSGSTSSASSSSAAGTEKVEGDDSPLSSLITTDEEGNTKLTAKSIFVIVLVVLIMSAVAGLVGYNLYLRHKKRNIVI